MSPLPFAFLASLPAFPSLGESIRFQLTGLAVVFIALGSIWVVMEVAAVWFKRHPQTSEPSAPAPTPAASPVDAEIAPATLAIIAAAVHVTIGGPYRIHAITAAHDSVDRTRKGGSEHRTTAQVR